MTTPELSSKGKRAAVSPDLTDPAQGSKKHVAGLGATPTDVRMMDNTAFVAAEDADKSPLTGQRSAPQANKRTHFRNTNAPPPKDAMTTLEVQKGLKVQKGLDHTKWTGESVHPEIADIYTKQIIRTNQPHDAALTFATDVGTSSLGLGLIMTKPEIEARTKLHIPTTITDDFFKHEHKSTAKQVMTLLSSLMEKAENVIDVVVHRANNKGESQYILSMAYVKNVPDGHTALSFLRALRIALTKADTCDDGKDTLLRFAKLLPSPTANETARATLVLHINPSTTPARDLTNDALEVFMELRKAVSADIWHAFKGKKETARLRTLEISERLGSNQGSATHIAKRQDTRTAKQDAQRNSATKLRGATSKEANGYQPAFCCLLSNNMACSCRCTRCQPQAVLTRPCLATCNVAEHLLEHPPCFELRLNVNQPWEVHRSSCNAERRRAPSASARS